MTQICVVACGAFSVCPSEEHLTLDQLCEYVRVCARACVCVPVCVCVRVCVCVCVREREREVVGTCR